ncbi:unnamed protein product [Paramecium pentaurelia]|uniref:Uncharacterized protein n=1 Tax=Paramecium pentaurelia TaxID=43138 RepID=A0A8S1S214_9CILI|nr:unnamed protein product [Paramecium pentaurelia]
MYTLKKIQFLGDTIQEKLLTRELEALISCESDFIVQFYGAFYSWSTFFKITCRLNN